MLQEVNSEAMAEDQFFSKRVPLFNTVAMLILCTVFFLLPFALRGARMAVTGIKNNVADWLPSDYPETQDLEEFRKYFIGEQFVAISGPWCFEGNPNFEDFKEKLREESLDYESQLRDSNRLEEIRAHRKGDELGLMFANDWHIGWGEHQEKWLQGRNGQWYFIKKNGQLFRWEGQNNVVDGFNRLVEKTVHGKNKAIGKFVDQFGVPPKGSEVSEYYKDPKKLFARPFKSVLTGPDAIEQMAGENGTIRMGDYSEDSQSAFEAKVEAHRRLTGSLFGPTPATSFRWTYASLLQHVDKDKRSILELDDMRVRFDAVIKHITDTMFEGDFSKLQSAGPDARLTAWYEMWDRLSIEAPPRQTCLIVTLNEPVLEELSRAIGRPLFGKPRGRILELATGECGISTANVHMGGPPCDNVAIDEEGTNTLMRLVSLSAIVGILLAYLSFRSIRITCMLFFVAGVSAISSLSYIWYAGSTLDAILLSMPSLVYVLALSSAVHLVNYYRDACKETGVETAVEKAFSHALFPCSLAAFTTALGLISLYTSNLIPIQKFGLFSAIAVLATVILLFTYLPAALSVWPTPGDIGSDPKSPKKKTFSQSIGDTWSKIGDWVIAHSSLVAVCSLLLMGVAAYGITRVETSVHLLKLFGPSAKILGDYRWMEENLGKLVPMEMVLVVDQSSQQEIWEPEVESTPDTDEPSDDDLAANNEDGSEQNDSDQEAVPDNPEIAEAKQEIAERKPNSNLEPETDPLKLDLKYLMLDRIEMSRRIRMALERFFGPESTDIVGRGTSSDIFVPLQGVPQLYAGGPLCKRRVINRQLIAKKEALELQDYYATAGKHNTKLSKVQQELDNAIENGDELWRISIRLAALNDVDYGDFINDLKTVVEPIMTAYEFRTKILKTLHQQLGDQALSDSRILFLGKDPKKVADFDFEIEEGQPISSVVDQTYLFADTLRDLFENKGYEFKNAKPDKTGEFYQWIDPTVFYDREGPKPADEKAIPFPTDEQFAEAIERFDCVVLLENSDFFDVEFIKSHSDSFVDARDHKFDILQKDEGKHLTAMERKEKGDDVDVAAIYTGIIPIVYKSQRALLQSLIQSICLAFVMIAVVMMILLRNWREKFSAYNSLNFSGGMISMIPNVFPVVVVFGAMGLLGVKVDIGSMMTASVAMGVAVDDTIHYLNWYRKGLAMGLTRKSSIKMAYDRVATAMTQTTLIGGFGLAAFAFSTFTPTQRFGVLMLILLMAALVGDLILLPAILSGWFGRFFGKERPDAVDQLPKPKPEENLDPSLTQEDPSLLELRVAGAGEGGFQNTEKPDDKKAADG